MPIVLVHGARARAQAVLQAFLPAAMAAGVPLLVPEFRKPDFDGFQRLAADGIPLGAVPAFESGLFQASRQVGADETAPLHLLGFSGGAQFAHRYAMLHPDRVARLMVVAAGWYTRLDGRPFPHGAQASTVSGGRPVDVDEFLRLPIRVLVGERDTKRDGLLRTGDRLDREQGGNRLARAVSWVEHLRRVATERGIQPDIEVQLLPDTGHSFGEALARGGLAQRALAFLAPPPAPATGGR